MQSTYQAAVRSAHDVAGGQITVDNLLFVHCPKHGSHTLSNSSDGSGIQRRHQKMILERYAGC
jgi:hypothetical protein